MSGFLQIRNVRFLQQPAVSPRGLGEIFYVAGERFGSFIVWDEGRLPPPRPGRAPMLRAHRLAEELGEDVLYISSYAVSGELPGFATRLAAFEQRIWPNEKFYLYQLGHEQ